VRSAQWPVDTFCPSTQYVGNRYNRWAKCRGTGWQIPFPISWHWKQTPTFAASTPGQL